MRGITRLCALILAAGTGIAQAADVNGVRLWAGPDGTRVVFDLGGPVSHQVFMLDNPARVVVDIDSARWVGPEASSTGVVRAVRHGPQPGGGLRIVLDVDAAV